MRDIAKMILKNFEKQGDTVIKSADTIKTVAFAAGIGGVVLKYGAKGSLKVIEKIL